MHSPSIHSKLSPSHVKLSEIASSPDDVVGTVVSVSSSSSSRSLRTSSTVTSSIFSSSPTSVQLLELGFSNCSNHSISLEREFSLSSTSPEPTSWSSSSSSVSSNLPLNSNFCLHLPFSST